MRVSSELNVHQLCFVNRGSLQVVKLKLNSHFLAL